MPGALVSTPLDGDEVDDDLDIARFTIRRVPERMKARKSDPLLPVLREKPDLARALRRLTERMKG